MRVCRHSFPRQLYKGVAPAGLRDVYKQLISRINQVRLIPERDNPAPGPPMSPSALSHAAYAQPRRGETVVERIGIPACSQSMSYINEHDRSRRPSRIDEHALIGAVKGEIGSEGS